MRGTTPEARMIIETAAATMPTAASCVRLSRSFSTSTPNATETSGHMK